VSQPGGTAVVTDALNDLAHNAVNLTDYRIEVRDARIHLGSKRPVVTVSTTI
jgi:hypothetical protein